MKCALTTFVDDILRKLADNNLTDAFDVERVISEALNAPVAEIDVQQNKDIFFTLQLSGQGLNMLTGGAMIVRSTTTLLARFLRVYVTWDPTFRSITNSMSKRPGGSQLCSRLGMLLVGFGTQQSIGV